MENKNYINHQDQGGVKYYDFEDFLYSCLTYIGNNKQTFIDPRLTKNLYDYMSVRTDCDDATNKDVIIIINEDFKKAKEVVNIINTENLEHKTLITVSETHSKYLGDKLYLTYDRDTRLPWEFFKKQYRYRAIGNLEDAIIDFIELSDWKANDNEETVTKKILDTFPGVKGKILEASTNYALDLIDDVYGWDENEDTVKEDFSQAVEN